jgi:hypothetical protein
MGNQTHAAGLAGQPTAAQLSELFNQINSGRITKQNFQYFLRDPNKSDQDVFYMGLKLNYFGPDEWKFHFGDDSINRVKIPKMPWDLRFVNSPSNSDKFFFLGLSHLNNRRLSVNRWRDVLDNRRIHPYFSVRSIPLDKDFYCHLGWYCHSKINFKIDIGDNLQYRMSNLSPKIRVPSLADRLSANILCCLLNNEYLDTNVLTREIENTYITGIRTEWVQDETIFPGIYANWVDKSNRCFYSSLAREQSDFN